MSNAVIESENLTVEQAIANLQSEDLGLRFYAAWWLGKFRVKTSEAVTGLINALHDNEDRTEQGDGYPLRRNAARALGKLGDPRAVPGLIRCLSCSDFYVREAAAQSLEMLGDRSAIASLMELLHQGLTHGQLVVNQPDLSHPYDAILEALGTLQAQESLADISPFLEHPTPRIQYAAARALYQLTGNPAFGDRLVQALDGQDLQLRRAALADLGAIGYLPGARAIANTLAENSLKLIALKGVLEQQINSSEQPQLSPGAIQVMNLMDDLL